MRTTVTSTRTFLLKMHDAILVAVRLNWGAARVDVYLSRQSDRVRLTARGVWSLTAPRQEPWGPSVWVDSVSASVHPETGMRKLDVAMQSGDVIEIIARELDLAGIPLVDEGTQPAASAED